MLSPMSLTPTASRKQGSTADGMMVHLQSQCELVKEVVNDYLSDKPRRNFIEYDHLLEDFDGCQWRMKCFEEKPDEMLIELFVPNYANIQELRVEDRLREIYGDFLLSITPNEQTSVVLRVPRSAQSSQSKIADDAALLRHYIVSYPYKKMLDAIKSGNWSSVSPFLYRLRPNEPVYLVPRSDHLSITYQIQQTDTESRSLMRVVLQEFAEARTTSSASCSWNEREVPADLQRHFPSVTEQFTQTSGSSTSSMRQSRPAIVGCDGWLTVTVFVNNLRSDQAMNQWVQQLSLFQNYLSYHLKATKGYIYGKLRYRAAKLLQVLNRAIIEDEMDEREKKLASGRTFIQR